MRRARSSRHRRAIRAVIVLAFAWSACGSSPTGADDPFGPPDDPIDAFAMKALIGAGINMGSSLEAPDEGEWGGGFITAADFDRIAERGFDSVRLPVRWYTHAVGDSIDAAWLFRVEQVVDQALDRVGILILNQHHENELFEDPDAHGDRFVRFWEQIAEHFRDHSHRLVFELLNEPHDRLDRDRLNAMQMEAYGRIRETNPTRVVVFGGAGYNSWYELVNGVQLPDDRRYVMAQIHRYAPNAFTHQDAGAGVTCCSAAQLDEATRGFDEAFAWSLAHHVPVIVGEFGTTNDAPLASRVAWIRAVVAKTKEKDFAPIVWSYHDGHFGLWDRTVDGAWTEPIIDALDLPYWEPETAP